MCGINGFNWCDDALVKRMNLATKNRGPDDSGVYADRDVSLGHNRLSIIDLSPNGHQPMANEDGTIWITFNGEIYNFQELRADLEARGHIFRSTTDTEVIIHAYEEYGLDLVSRFNGMWAFCIYDSRKGLLVLSRDQFGIKPLYYYMDEKKFIFSSMISGILAHGIPTSPNDTAIMEYLAHNLEDHDSYTFFNNVSSMKKDHLLIYDLKTRKITLKKWFNSHTAAPPITKNIRDGFINSVKLRLISDVPVGSCLSGGLDSSSIVLIVDRLLQKNFFTFSFTSPGSVFDESRYIREVGKHTNTKQFFTSVSPGEFLEDFQDFILAQEEPLTGLSPYAEYRVMKLARENGAKVLLNGQGGDEIFAGYVYYYSYLFVDLLKSLKWVSLAKEMIDYHKAFKDLYPHAMFAFLLLPGPLQYRLWKRVLNPWIDHDYMKKVCTDLKDPRWAPISLNDALYLTLFSTAIPHLLKWTDKNSMRWSVECRLPFLDPALVQSALSASPEEKLRNGRTKVLFRESMDDLLIEAIRERRDKIGFVAPVDDIFRDEKVVSFCKNIIYSESFMHRPYWKWAKVEKLFSDHVARKKNVGDTIFKFICLELWMRAFFKDGAAQ